MKFANLKIMTIPRLKAYRKSVMARTRAYEVCWCGDNACDHERFKNQDNQHYKHLLIEYERVNKELARKQTVERKAKENPMAQILTVREERNLVKLPKWRRLQMDTYHRRKAKRQAAAKAEEARGPGRTIIFHFEQTGFNAHVADGKFTYDTPEGAKRAAESMRKQPGFTKVEIV
jgi:hypothetical protein